MDTAGNEHVIYDFTGAPDCANPRDGLEPMHSTFYGVTEGGGANDKGCIFEVNARGNERVLYSFKGGAGDGSSPSAGLTAFDGVLYGVTLRGGTNDFGTVFSIGKDGTEKVVYNFSGSDGRLPRGKLTVFKNALYGTTFRGGAGNDGTIFEITRQGKLRTLHSFSGADGIGPKAGLTVFGEALFGTTAEGVNLTTARYLR